MAGFLAGLLAPALTVATNAAATNQGAQAMGQRQQMQDALQRLSIVAQQREMALKNALTQAQTGEAQANTQKATREAGQLRLGDPGYAGAMGQVSSAQAVGALPAKLQEAVTKGQIDLNTALAVAAAQHANKTQEITQQGDIQNAGRIAGIKQTQSGQIVPNLLKLPQAIFGSSNAPTPQTPQPATSNPFGDLVPSQ